MLYTLVGNGDANRKEVLATIESLITSAVKADEEFWMVLAAEASPSKTSIELVKHLVSKGIYFEVIAPKNAEMDSIYEAAQEIFQSENVYRTAVNIAERRAAPDEQSSILVMDDDLEENDYLMEAISIASDRGIPVYELGGQMVQIILEDTPTQPDVDEVVEELVEEADWLAVAAEDDVKAFSDVVYFSRPDLEELTLNELKVLVNSMGLVPRDLRSKDSLIDALMKESADAPVEEPVVETPKADGRKYYLLTVEEDGSVSISPHDPS